MKTFALTLSAIVLGFAMLAFDTTPASACPPGYKSVKIQGHWLCRLDVIPPGLKLKMKLN